MSRKVYKIIDLGDGRSMEILGSNRDIQTYTTYSGENEETKFKYRGCTYKLSDFINVHNKVYNPNPPGWMLEFDGHLATGYYSGILIKLGENSESVKVYECTVRANI